MDKPPKIRIGDIVSVDTETAYDKEHWGPLGKIKGVVIGFADDDTARVRWLEDCGLSVHWHTNTLVSAWGVSNVLYDKINEEEMP